MEKIINKLRYFDEKFPREALKDCVNMKEEAAQVLLDELDKIIARPEIATEDEDFMLHLYAIYLLAQFKEKRAFERIVKLISLTPDEIELLFGDVITEDLPAVLYSTFDGNLTLLQETIENPVLNIYVRGSALDVYAKLYSDGLIKKEACIDYLRELIDDDSDDFDLATDVQGVVINKHIFEMIDDIQYLYDQDRIDTAMFGEYDDFIDLIYTYENERERVRYITDVAKEMSWWACFEKTEDEKRKTKAQMKKMMDAMAKENKPRNHEGEKPKKIGRNDSCPCGSGKKHKNCCLGKEVSVEVESGKDYSESAEEQKKWLKYYPIEKGEGGEGELRVTDLYDKESIDIDQLVYLALHHRPIPLWQERDEFTEGMIAISYLTKAYEKFISKCEDEDINSFSEYDNKHKIHYRSKEWIERFNGLIQKNKQGHKYKDILKKINKTISRFS